MKIKFKHLLYLMGFSAFFSQITSGSVNASGVLPISEIENKKDSNSKNTKKYTEINYLNLKDIDKNLKVRVLLHDDVDKFYIIRGNSPEIREDYKSFIEKYPNKVAEFNTKGYLDSTKTNAESETALETHFLLIVNYSSAAEPLQYKLNRTNLLKIKKSSRAASLQIVLELPLSEYLAVVVNSEIPNSWPVEALKAQAIAARTYLLNQLEYSRHSNAISDYDVVSSVADQRFNGTENVSTRAINAVTETENLILIDKYGLLANVFYSSSHGGFISAPEFTWRSSTKHYLIPKIAYSESGPFNSWNRKFSDSELNRLLGVNSLKVADIKPLAADYLLISDKSKKTLLLIGEELRHKLSLPSSSFIIEKDKEKDTWLFSGTGFGHGIGMSQYGAKAMANDGKTYREILAFYYPGTNLLRK